MPVPVSRVFSARQVLEDDSPFFIDHDQLYGIRARRFGSSARGEPVELRESVSDRGKCSLTMVDSRDTWRPNGCTIRKLFAGMATGSVNGRALVEGVPGEQGISQKTHQVRRLARDNRPAGAPAPQHSGSTPSR